MEGAYIKSLDNKVLFMENIEEKEKRHELESVVFNRDITGTNIKQGVDEIRNH